MNAGKLWIVLLCMVFTVWGCEDTPASPDAERGVVLEPGLTAYLVVDRDRAPVGHTIRITVNLRVVGEETTPTAYLANLSYDPDLLKPVAVVALEDGVVRAVNLHAGLGRIRAAGAAGSGLGTETLFAVEFRVRHDEYPASLSLDLEELVVLEQNFADLAGRVTVVPNPIPARGMVAQRR